MELDREKSSTPFLISFSINNLFGYQNSHLDFSRKQNDNGNYINVIYGENGGGKTTLLKFIYNFLATEGRGIKTWIARLPFDSAHFLFSDGRSFYITKPARVGSYTVYHEFGGEVNKYDILVSEDLAVREEVANSDYLTLRAMLESINFDLFYVTDRREYFTTSKAMETIKYRKSKKTTNYDDFLRLQLKGAEADEERPINISDMSNIISQIFRSQILESGLFGQQNTNSIYLELVRSLSRGGEDNTATFSRSELEGRLLNLEKLMSDGARFGVMPHIDFRGFINAIKGAPPETLKQIGLVLGPFMEGHFALIDAAKVQVDRMKSFIDELNRFYHNKDFHFDMRKGFYIKSKIHGDDVAFEWLSSGERQLFTILSSIFLTQNSSGIVLIDEPELSLNVTWQREFASALMRISKNSPVQYILASHSLEILSNSAVNVVPLSDSGKF